METRNLKTFIHVAELMSFSKTAEQLGYAQSSITAQIDSLEKELGAPLFIRNGKRFILSAEGSQLLDYAHKLVNLEAEAKSLFQDESKPSGMLRIGILESVSASHYSNVFAHYLRQYPAVTLHVTVATTLQLMDMLEKGSLDVIITLDIPVNNPKFQLCFSQPSPICFFSASNHPLTRSQQLYLRDLVTEPFLLTEKKCNYRQVFEDTLAIKRLQMINTLEIGYTQILIDCVVNTLGISLLPEFNLYQALKSEKIAILDVHDCKIELFLQIFVLQRQWLSPANKQFLKMLVDHFKKMN